MAQSVMGFFPYVNDLRKAASRLKTGGYEEMTVFSPVPISHEIDEVIGEGTDYIKYFTFFGGVAGFILGTVFALGTAALYVLP
ncbi:MAG: quinol:electron acceptor oxidoreductase subunit ActD, partial [Thermodesulfobacteriota bacterium]